MIPEYYSAILFIGLLLAKILRDEDDKFETSILKKSRFFRWWTSLETPFDMWHFCYGVIANIAIQYIVLIFAPYLSVWKVIQHSLIIQFGFYYPIFSLFHHNIMRLEGSRDWCRRSWLKLPLCFWDIEKVILAAMYYTLGGYFGLL